MVKFGLSGLLFFKIAIRDTWLVQSVECMTIDLRAVSSSPTWAWNLLKKSKIAISYNVSTLDLAVLRELEFG